MRIAQIAPLHESVPPQQYGGTERVVSYLTEELVRRGHDVTLFASQDSRTSATLVPCCPHSLRLAVGTLDPLIHHYLMLEEVLKRSDKFDILHFHIDYLHFPLSRRSEYTQLTTLHGRLDIPDLKPLYREYGEMPVVSISDSQRRPLPEANWTGTVYHGLPRNQYNPKFSPGSYLAFLGRISPEKRVDRAIRIAIEVGMELRIAAKIDKADRDYFETSIRPYFSHPLVRYLGEVDEKGKNEFLRNASALLFPIDWEEPFGLVMIESMACGTPVVAWERGSVPEIIEPGKNGVIVNTEAEAVAAISHIAQLSRQRCFESFQDRFLVERMADDYLALYENLLEKRKVIPHGSALRSR